MCRRFKYPMLYRLLYLWGTTAIVVTTLSAAVFLFQKRDPLAIAIALLISVPMLTQAYVGARRYASLLPVEITLENGWVSLYRFYAYRRFHLDSIVAVHMNQNPGFAPPVTGGWIKVEYETDGERQHFYIGPFISDFVELVDVLRGTTGYVPAERAMFCWPKRVRLYQWIAALGVVPIAIGLLAIALLTSSGIWQVVEVAICLAVIVTIVWTMGMLPTCVEVGEDRIAFKFPIRPDVEMYWSDVLSVDVGGHLSMFAISVSFARIRFRNGGKLLLAPFFEDYTDMVDLLQEKVGRLH